MARVSLRDRFFTPRVARAVTSPSGILLAGAGVAVGIVVGLPVAAAAAVGAAAYGLRVAVAIPRGNEPAARVDPFALQDPWRTFVWEARRSQRRFHDATQKARKGPLRERLGTIGARIDTAVGECWEIAKAGHALTDARAAIDVADLTADLEALVGPGRPPPEPGSRLARTAAALSSQLATAARIDATIADTRERLQLLDARLGEAVTRAIELSARAQGSDDLTGLDADVDDLVGEMEALRQALDDTSPAALAAQGGATGRVADLAGLGPDAAVPGSGIGDVDPGELDGLTGVAGQPGPATSPDRPAPPPPEAAAGSPPPPPFAPPPGKQTPPPGTSSGGAASTGDDQPMPGTG